MKTLLWVVVCVLLNPSAGWAEAAREHEADADRSLIHLDVVWAIGGDAHDHDDGHDNTPDDAQRHALRIDPALTLSYEAESVIAGTAIVWDVRSFRVVAGLGVDCMTRDPALSVSVEQYGKSLWLDMHGSWTLIDRIHLAGLLAIPVRSTVGVGVFGGTEYHLPAEARDVIGPAIVPPVPFGSILFAPLFTRERMLEVWVEEGEEPPSRTSYGWSTLLRIHAHF